MPDMPRLEDKFYTVEEVADYFMVTAQTVRLWINEKDSAKRLNATKLGRGWRVTRAAIIDYGTRRYADA